MQRQTRKYEEKSLVMLAPKKPPEPLLNIKMREFLLHDRIDNSESDIISLNTFAKASLEQTVSAAESWIDEWLSTHLENILRDEGQIAFLCFQAAQERRKHAEASRRSPS